MNTETNKIALLNVRNAFRTLAAYQQSMLSIANYIKNRTGIKDAQFLGAKRFSNPIGRCQLKEEYDSKLRIWPEMWSWDFLYGYIFEYYLGCHMMKSLAGEKNVSISILQVSDDGYFRANREGRNPIVPSTFSSADSSNSWIIVCVGYDGGWYYIPEIMSPKTYQESNWSEVAALTIEHLILDNKDLYVNRTNENGDTCLFIARRFNLEQFFSCKDIDTELRSFGAQINDISGLTLFDF